MEENVNNFWPILDNGFQSGNCYEDNIKRILPDRMHVFPMTNQKLVCISACVGYRYAGVQYGSECWCGNELPNRTYFRPKEQCKKQCPGAKSEICGGEWRMNIYSAAEKCKLNIMSHNIMS